MKGEHAMDNNNLLKIKNTANDLITDEFSVPIEIKETINKVVKNTIENKTSLLNNENLKKKLEIIVTPELQKGIEEGKFTKVKGALEIRDKETGQFVGKGKIEETLVSKADSDVLATVTKGIVNIAGQAQLAEISQKLDIIDEKLAAIGKHNWREKTAELSGAKSFIEDAVESLPNKYAVERINNEIADLIKLSNFFKKTIEEELDKPITYSLYNNVIEGFKFWEWKEENRQEYNSKYNSDVSKFVNRYGYLLDLYFQTLGLIGTCYQITNEHHHASKYYRQIERDINYFSVELTSRLVYLLNIQDIDEEYILFQHIIEKLEDRKLPNNLLNEMNIVNEKITESKYMQKNLVTQFDHLQLSYDVDPKLIMEGEDHDET